MTSTTWRGVEAQTPEGHTRDAARRHPAVRTAARVGLVARGVLYAVVGVLALRLAFGEARETADKNGALLAVARQPVGKGLLAVLAGGFAAYCVWMVVRALVVRDDAPLKAWAKRVHNVFRAAVYGALAWSAVDTIRRASSAPRKSSNRQHQEWTARVLGWPGGRILVAAVGAALVIGAASFIFRAVTEKWRERLDLAGTSAATTRTVRVVAWAGWLGRGIAFGLVGLFIVRAGWQFDPKEAVGLDGALRRVVHGAWGPFLLCVIAVGLFAFGCYSMIEARFRRVMDT